MAAVVGRQLDQSQKAVLTSGKIASSNQGSTSGPSVLPQVTTGTAENIRTVRPGLLCPTYPLPRYLRKALSSWLAPWSMRPSGPLLSSSLVLLAGLPGCICPLFWSVLYAQNLFRPFKLTTGHWPPSFLGTRKTVVSSPDQIFRARPIDSSKNKKGSGHFHH